MTNLPRVASSEFRMDGLAKRLSGLDTKIDRAQQRRRLHAEHDETSQKVVLSHRGAGSVMPPPSAPPKGAFTEALAARATPPSSTTITADLADDVPMWREDLPMNPVACDISTPLPEVQPRIQQQLMRLDPQLNDTDAMATNATERLTGMLDTVSAFSSAVAGNVEDIENRVKASSPYGSGARSEDTGNVSFRSETESHLAQIDSEFNTLDRDHDWKTQ